MECREERSCVSLNKHWSTVDPGDSLVVFLVRVVELWLPGGEGAEGARQWMVSLGGCRGPPRSPPTRDCFGVTARLSRGDDADPTLSFLRVGENSKVVFLQTFQHHGSPA